MYGDNRPAAGPMAEAALEMYEALKAAEQDIASELALSGYDDDDMRDHPVLIKVRAAIAKAEGK